MNAFASTLSLALALAACSAPNQPAADHANTAASTRDVQHLYGLEVKGKVRTAIQSGQVVTANLDIVETADESHVVGNVEVTIDASDVKQGDLAAIRPGVTVQAFVNSPSIDKTTHTILAQKPPYQATLVKVIASPVF